jgi:hypothetical protein
MSAWRHCWCSIPRRTDSLAHRHASVCKHSASQRSHTDEFYLHAAACCAPGSHAGVPVAVDVPADDEGVPNLLSRLALCGHWVAVEPVNLHRAAAAAARVLLHPVHVRVRSLQEYPCRSFCLPITKKLHTTLCQQIALLLGGAEAGVLLNLNMQLQHLCLPGIQLHMYQGAK